MSKRANGGVDSVSFGILLKSLGKAWWVDEAFHILESVDLGTAAGNPRLSPKVIYGLLNAVVEAGIYKHQFPLGALTVIDEIPRQGLKPDILTYNTLVLAWEEARKYGSYELLPDDVTYTTLLKLNASSHSLSIGEMQGSIVSKIFDQQKVRRM